MEFSQFSRKSGTTGLLMRSSAGYEKENTQINENRAWLILQTMEYITHNPKWL